MMYVVVNCFMYNNAFINDGALPIKVGLLRCQRLYVEYLTDSVWVCHGVGGFGCQTTIFVFKIIHVSLAYVGHRMNLYFDEPTAEKDNSYSYKVSNFFCKTLWGNDWLNGVLNGVNYDGLAQLPK